MCSDGLMKVYADSPGQFARQLVSDVALLCWVLLWIWAGMAVHDATMELTGPGYQITESASGISDSMAEAGGVLEGLPLVGDEARAPFDKASGAADELARELTRAVGVDLHRTIRTHRLGRGTQPRSGGGTG